MTIIPYKTDRRYVKVIIPLDNKGLIFKLMSTPFNYIKTDGNVYSFHVSDWEKVRGIINGYYPNTLPKFDFKIFTGYIQNPSRDVMIHLDFTDGEIIDKIKGIPRGFASFQDGTYRIKPSNESFKAINDIISLGKLNTSGLDLKKFEKDIPSGTIPNTLELSSMVEGLDIKVDTKLPLRGYQKVAIHYAERSDGKALIADEMGIGKTPTAIGFVLRNPGKTVVICPAMVKLNWSMEIQKFTNYTEDDIQIVSGRKSLLEGKYWTIINYDIVNGYVKSLKSMNINTLIVDEGHYIKSQKSRRSEAVLSLGVNIKNILVLTGTPLKNNRPIELWNIITLLKKGWIFGNFWNYAKRFCDAHEGDYGWDMNGMSNVDELYKLLRATTMIRRLKKDVLTELPPKVHQRIVLDDIDLSEYRKVDREFKDWVKINGKTWNDRTQVIVRIEKLKQAAARAKLDSIKKWLKDFLETSEEKILVYAHHKEIQLTLFQQFKDDAVWIRSGNDQKEVFDFNTGKKQIAIIALQAGGIGINLQTANNVLFTELAWTPEVHLQAEDRTHRMGQTKSVNVYYVVARHTIDIMILNLLNKKEREIEMVLDGGGTTEDVEIDMLYEIMKEFSPQNMGHTMVEGY